MPNVHHCTVTEHTVNIVRTTNRDQHSLYRSTWFVFNKIAIVRSKRSDSVFVDLWCNTITSFGLFYPFELMKFNHALNVGPFQFDWSSMSLSCSMAFFPLSLFKNRKIISLLKHGSRINSHYHWKQFNWTRSNCTIIRTIVFLLSHQIFCFVTDIRNLFRFLKNEF